MVRRTSFAALVAVLLGTVGCGRIGYGEPTDEEADAEVDGAVDAASVDADPTDALAACPSGTVEVCSGSLVCIEIVERGYDTWPRAVSACAAVGRRLCTGAEWDEACPCATSLTEMFNDTAGLEWEWVAEESEGIAHKRGYGSCADTSTHPVTDSYAFRCCADR
jgi:hypothetical protein